MTIILILLGVCAPAALLWWVVIPLAINAPLYWCRSKHGKYHKLDQIGYGSQYYVRCSKCQKSFVQYRNP